MRLSFLLGPEIIAPDGFGGVEITGLTADSRNVSRGYLFAALEGVKTDGARFIADAVSSGAAAILAPPSAPVPPTGCIPVLRAEEPRLALARIAARFHERQPDVAVAVTGTSGKTSVVEFARQIFAHLGHKAASRRRPSDS
jgi:UDP-N-acetylmuramyl tripeptide synthase